VAQLAAPQAPSQRLLVLPFEASAADSAGSIALADLVRDRLTALTKNKVWWCPKPSCARRSRLRDFPATACSTISRRANSRFLQVHAYLTGKYVKEGSSLRADVHLIDIASSGMSGGFTVTNGNPGTAAALADSIAQRVATIAAHGAPNGYSCVDAQCGIGAHAHDGRDPLRDESAKAAAVPGLPFVT